MEEERPLIHISAEDITEANRLSLNCPICAGGVENNIAEDALTPVVCAKCETLYHQACWQQNGGKCAILGCGHDQFYRYGEQFGSPLRIKYTDLPKDVPPTAVPSNGKELKEQEKRLQKELNRRTFWNELVQNILRAIGWR
jgi:hypothetical protein